MVKKKSAREDMREDGDIDDQEITLVMAKQLVKSFDQNFDKVALKNIEDLRTKSGAKSKAFVKEYDTLKKSIDKLKLKYNL